MKPICPAALHRAVSLRDLSDPADGPHAMQRVVDAIVDRLRVAWRCPVVVQRASPITTVADNYDRLHYPPDGAARSARYTRWITPTRLLRTHTTAMVPPLLRMLAAAGVEDALLVCPGVVYRRDCIDRLHTGAPHQLDLWRIGPALSEADLDRMIAMVVEAALPGAAARCPPAEHPYTERGREIEVRDGGAWVEIGEAGLASAAVLHESGLHPSVSGLAMGLGLDRLLMLRKGIDDIRLLRSEDPRVTVQMQDLSAYRSVSSRPPIRRDLSLAVDATTDAELLGDRVRAALGPDAASVEEVVILAETRYQDLPVAAIERLGMRPGQINVLLRVVIRDLERTLTDAEANRLRDRIYAALHEGTAHEWADPYEVPP